MSGPASSSSPPEAFDQHFLNNLGAACRESISKNERLLSKCFQDIEAGSTVDVEIILRNTSDALAPVKAMSVPGEL
ncbi:hypothetical protein Pmar_PMAR012070 [Perkinsus marinus ATCC 50983]|uniref:Uncharacterized protein n=1 Tax=Perkinsus marinus (strain ATCC 50983 / TXsc) TaxID=423536 RepID=C5LV38_PERM5|nr:hypothetical protein Pmar_PMAR012070 [Perkinsus marinus ATCC 50983]EEQ99406.1 hypothetical protein Pmar_PMAR012070 [Perkinsus marinus ATCC 50983]|eukprot:XP_002766689.1 hypothetical protein Pmar_PMAR012070 [Perkinsus marinus ATCC 50983]